MTNRTKATKRRSDEATERLGLRRAVFFLSLAMLGCHAPPQRPASYGPMYPAPPATARVQFLTALSGDKNLERDAPIWFRRLIGAPQAESTPLQKPYGLAARAGRLYVCDTNRRDIFVFDFAAGTFSYWPHPGTELNKPVAIRVTAAGEIDICDAGANQVLRFSHDGRLLKAIGPAALRAEQRDATPPAEFHPVGIGDGPDGSLAILNSAAHRIDLVEPASAQRVASWASIGSQSGQLYRPNALAQAAAGELLVSDPMNRRVTVFDTSGKVVRQIGEPGDQPGYIAHPRGLAVDEGVVVFLGDVALQRVQMFDLQGNYLMSFGHTADGSAIPAPAGICTDRSCLSYFRHLIAPDFAAEYLIFVSNQVGPDKILVYAFGQATSASQSE